MADDGSGIVQFPVTMREFTFGPREAIRRREWLIPGLAMKKHISELVAQTSTGKTSFTVALGMLAACGRQFGPFKPRRKLRIAAVCAEEDYEEAYRRVGATADCFDIEPRRDFADGTFKYVQFANSPPLAIADKRGKGSPTRAADPRRPRTDLRSRIDEPRGLANEARLYRQRSAPGTREGAEMALPLFGAGPMTLWAAGRHARRPPFRDRIKRHVPR
ncbi:MULTISPECIES: AAA family ATPase [unclassified Rhizobium]|uniref:AAA family ATPase n=1 Tax=unclassified Rhizobium TaxID=2613769 RepID=UPI0016209E61|nr:MULTISPECIES: AAA family ATPase [unclassified Rhizobium]MBB3545175.1 hypothetical protein [Rhizobium sp. BK399]MCS3743588.1 hypothetical protein [Rhizobium sp. BK661]MCS4096525.1 hypothetical protein [Rhizobium sp. BK176]